MLFGVLVDVSLHRLKDGGDIDVDDSNKPDSFTQQDISNEVHCYHDNGVSCHCPRGLTPFYGPRSTITTIPQLPVFVNHYWPSVHYLMLSLGLLIIIFFLSFPRITFLGTRPKILLISAFIGVAIFTLDYNGMPIADSSLSSCCCPEVMLASYAHINEVLAGTISVSLTVIYSLK